MTNMASTPDSENETLNVTLSDMFFEDFGTTTTTASDLITGFLFAIFVYFALSAVYGLLTQSSE